MVPAIAGGSSEGNGPRTGRGPGSALLFSFFAAVISRALEFFTIPRGLRIGGAHCWLAPRP